jgi:plasmid stabilization system protein ParE
MSASPLAVVLARRAERQLEAALAWWAANRPAAPNLLLDEFTRALELLSLQPSIGATARSERLRGLRRVLLEPVGYHIYYRVRPVRRSVEVLALWHARRGSTP